MKTKDKENILKAHSSSGKGEIIPDGDVEMKEAMEMHRKGKYFGKFK